MGLLLRILEQPLFSPFTQPYVKRLYTTLTVVGSHTNTMRKTDLGTKLALCMAVQRERERNNWPLTLLSPGPTYL